VSILEPSENREGSCGKVMRAGCGALACSSTAMSVVSSCVSQAESLVPSLRMIMSSRPSSFLSPHSSLLYVLPPAPRRGLSDYQLRRMRPALRAGLYELSVPRKHLARCVSLRLPSDNTAARILTFCSRRRFLCRGYRRAQSRVQPRRLRCHGRKWLDRLHVRESHDINPFFE
jgi:hypothetical protein